MRHSIEPSFDGRNSDGEVNYPCLTWQSAGKSRGETQDPGAEAEVVCAAGLSQPLRDGGGEQLAPECVIECHRYWVAPGSTSTKMPSIDIATILENFPCRLLCPAAVSQRSSSGLSSQPDAAQALNLLVCGKMAHAAAAAVVFLLTRVLARYSSTRHSSQLAARSSQVTGAQMHERTED